MLIIVLALLLIPESIHLARLERNPTLECTCTSTHFEDTRFAVKCQRNSSGQWNVKVDQETTTPVSTSDDPTPFRLFVEQSTVTCEQGSLKPPGPDYLKNDTLGYYYKLHTEGVSWERARRVCLQERAHLAIVDSKEEVQELSRIFSLYPNIADEDWLNNQAYIGIHDQVNEGEFVTIFGKKPGYIDFEPGEPNNGNGQEGENCVTIVRSGKMNDVNCELPLPYFCQQKI